MADVPGTQQQMENALDAHQQRFDPEKVRKLYLEVIRLGALIDELNDRRTKVLTGIAEILIGAGIGGSHGKGL